MMMSPHVFSQASIFQCFSPSLTISGYNLHGNGIYTMYLYIFFPPWLSTCLLLLLHFPFPFFCFLFDSHTTAFFGEMCGGKKRKTKKRKGRPAGWWLKLGNIRKRDENYSAKTKTKEKHRRARGYTTTEWERERETRDPWESIFHPRFWPKWENNKRLGKRHGTNGASCPRSSIYLFSEKDIYTFFFFISFLPYLGAKDEDRKKPIKSTS